ncbi:carboxylic acid reductase [mine drainage metagenome]|uniref:Carboxylic acid reductase n=1 Tax=mine drainage metagenome TaxID=410659 RepID=A0A1J5R952_9ZZZZ
MPAPYRAARLGGTTTPRMVADADGALIISSPEALGDYPARLTDRLEHWAEVCPERTLAAKREESGAWRHLNYREALAQARAIAEALSRRGLSAERPVMVISGNDLEHLGLMLGAMWAGVPYAPVSPAYSLVSEDFAKLKHIFAVLTPGLVFASDGDAYRRALGAVVPDGVEIVLAKGGLAGRPFTPFADLLATPATAIADRAHAATGPDSIAKLLFTSGSTKQPKGVINTQRMLCSNQQMILQSMPFLADEPPVLVDWLPWNHTFGGNHNLGIVLYNGGSLYIDAGKPTPQLIGETLRNLREISPTIYFNVPMGFEKIAAALEADQALQQALFARLRAFMFAGAGLSQVVWDQLEQIAARVCGERIRMLTSLGMTETAPFALFPGGAASRPAVVGLPAAGLTVKLACAGNKREVRYRGPSVTPGYWRAEAQTRESFDEDGFFCSGDALKFEDDDRPGLGLLFDGRIAEDFKLSSGTFVSVGPLRARVIAEGAPYVQDVVATAPNRDDLGILIFPNPDACRELAGAGRQDPLSSVLASRAVREFFQQLVDRLYHSGSGSANRVVRALLLAEPASIDKGELTDKGSINQRAVLNHRAALVQALYQEQGAELIFPRT